MSFVTSNLESHNFNIIPVTKDSTHFEEREKLKIVPYPVYINAAERCVRMRKDETQGDKAWTTLSRRALCH